MQEAQQRIAAVASRGQAAVATSNPSPFLQRRAAGLSRACRSRPPRTRGDPDCQCGAVSRSRYTALPHYYQQARQNRAYRLAPVPPRPGGSGQGAGTLPRLKPTRTAVGLGPPPSVRRGRRRRQRRRRWLSRPDPHGPARRSSARTWAHKARRSRPSR